MYVSETRRVRVSVKPHFLSDRSEPDESRYFWAYTIEIRNNGSDTVRLASRYWHITDETGQVEEVRGPGVVGETPMLAPGEAFTYTSGCPLRTPSGIMRGHYVMEDAAGQSFDVAIPAFSLDSPYARRSIN